MHEHGADHRRREVRIEAQRLADEVVHRRRSLDAGEAAAGDDERQQTLADAGAAFGVGLLEQRDHAVAQHDRIAERFHRERALLETGKAEEVRHRAERDHQMVVRQLVGVRIGAVRHDDGASREVDALDVAVEELHARQELADGIHDVGDVEVARGDLVQHRREEEKIVAAHDRHLHAAVAAEPPLQLERGVDAAEAAADDHDPR